MKSQFLTPIEAKHLSACVECKLILNDSQWHKCDIKCPNCNTGNKTECTSRFSGMVSYIHPHDSWVAKFNVAQMKIPGVYALHVHN